jgi:biofilm PGA synthesis N-glycosyltransferase PgaC
MFLGILLGYAVSGDPRLVLSHMFIMSALFLILLTLYLRFAPRLFQANASSPRAKFSFLRVARYVLFDEYLLLLAWKDFFSGRYSVLWEKIDSTRASAEPAEVHLG